ncbi:MAG: GTP cyclohydrolase II [Pseudomonadales bacterium]|jgi:GTP cyclohydrolase II|tara:strand:- start:35813 stop:36403 length:591 start_codon:yes stop_codon:yes gene_type:complete
MSAKIYAETKLPTEFGELRLRAYRDDACETHLDEPLALVSGFLDPQKPINVRIHSSCLTSEVLGSCKCDCKQQLDQSLAYIKENTGVVIYLHQEGRGIGIGDKVRVYALQEHGYDTIEANEMLGLPIDARRYDQAVDILKDLGVKQVNLLTNNPDKINYLTNAGFDVIQRTPVHGTDNVHSAPYIETKRTRMGHML